MLSNESLYRWEIASTKDEQAAQIQPKQWEEKENYTEG